MKKIFFILSVLIIWSCHTPLSCVDRHPENYTDHSITISGFAQDWLQDFHGYYFIVLTNRYRTHHLMVYKQIPYLRPGQRIKASGYLLKTRTRNNQTVYILVDTSQFTFKLPLEKGRIVEPLRYRDTLPTLLWYQTQK